MQNRLKMVAFNVFFRIVQNQKNRELKLKQIKEQFFFQSLEPFLCYRKNRAFFKPFPLCIILFALFLAYSVFKNSLNLRIS